MTWIPKDPEARRIKQRAHALSHARRKSLAQSSLVVVGERGRLRLVPVPQLLDLLRRGIPRQKGARAAGAATAGASSAQVAGISSLLKRLDRMLTSAASTRNR